MNSGRRLAAMLATFVAVACVLAGSREVQAEERFALVIANTRGDVGETELRWAAADGQKFARVLRDLGGLPLENLVTLIDEDADTARRALIALNDRVRQAPAGATLIVYFSGHGDAASLHLGLSKLALSELEALVRGSAATLRLLVVDACQSGGLNGVKGGLVRASPRVAVPGGQRADGVVFLTASAATEPAQESDKLRGSFFTHYLVSGLVGAADRARDNRVDVDEAYEYAYTQTLRASSASVVGLQHPTYRQEVRGRTPFVLTRLREGKDQAVLIFPPSQTWIVFKGNDAGPVVAELQADDPQRALTLHTDKLFVRGRVADTLLEGNVTPTVGQVISVRDLRLEQIKYGAHVRKGADVGAPIAANNVEAGYLVGRTLTGADGVCQGPWGGWIHEREAISFSLRSGVCFSGFTNAALASESFVWDLEARLHHVWDLRYLSLEVSGALGAAWLHETFDTTGFAPTRNSAAARIDLATALLFDVTEALYLRAEIGAELWLLRRDDGTGARTVPVLGPRGRVGLGVRF